MFTWLNNATLRVHGAVDFIREYQKFRRRPAGCPAKFRGGQRLVKPEGARVWPWKCPGQTRTGTIFNMGFRVKRVKSTRVPTLVDSRASAGRGSISGKRSAKMNNFQN